MHSFIGYEHDEGSWARAIRESLRAPYVGQERVRPARTVFPMMNFGHLEFKEMQVDSSRRHFLCKVAGCLELCVDVGSRELFAGFGFHAYFHH